MKPIETLLFSRNVKHVRLIPCFLNQRLPFIKLSLNRNGRNKQESRNQRSIFLSGVFDNRKLNFLSSNMTNMQFEYLHCVTKITISETIYFSCKYIMSYVHSNTAKQKFHACHSLDVLYF